MVYKLKEKVDMTLEQKQLAEARQFCPTQTRRKVFEEGALMVDVRERDEVKKLAFDVPALINIPLSELEQRFAELPRDRELILVCTLGKRSLKATYFLMYQGYEHVANMEHGLERWAGKGFPVIGDITASSACTCNCSSATNSEETKDKQAETSGCC